jgi:enoyl-CoA hydratase
LITAFDCDHRIAGDGILQSSLNEVPIGIPMLAVYCEIINYAVGLRAASELTLFGQVYDLPAVVQMGIVQKAVTPNKLLDAAVAWAALVPPDWYTAYAFSKCALQATTIAAIDAAARFDRDWLDVRSRQPARPCAPISRVERQGDYWPIPS